MYIQNGGVKLSLVNEAGREAVLALLGPGDYFGEGCLTGVPFRMSIATAVTATTVPVIDAKEMIRGLHEEQRLSDRFIAYLLTRIIRVEEDLVDLVFNSIEKRLARALLLLARYGRQDQPQNTLPKISQEPLAETVGTTRSRINMFMNKFRRLGFIEYNGGGIQIHKHVAERDNTRIRPDFIGCPPFPPRCEVPAHVDFSNGEVLMCSRIEPLAKT